jgi:hypothetical protein
VQVENDVQPGAVQVTHGVDNAVEIGSVDVSAVWLEERPRYWETDHVESGATHEIQIVGVKRRDGLARPLQQTRGVESAQQHASAEIVDDGGIP